MVLGKRFFQLVTGSASIAFGYPPNAFGRTQTPTKQQAEVMWMKAVIYARYSSDNQREEIIEGQLRECKEYAEKNGITILRI